MNVFRVTAFYALYAMQPLGWTEAQAAEFRATIWAGSDYPIWEKYITRIKFSTSTRSRAWRCTSTPTRPATPT